MDDLISEKMDDTTAVSNTFRFLDLPPEIRLMIYRYSIHPKKTISINCGAESTSTYLPELAHVCQQISAEFKAEFFGSTTFLFGKSPFGIIPLIIRRRAP